MGHFGDICFPPNHAKWRWFCLKGFYSGTKWLCEYFEEVFQQESITTTGSWLSDWEHGPAMHSRCCLLLPTQAVEMKNQKTFTCPGDPITLNGGMNLLINILDKTPERWCLRLLTDGLFIWHLTRERSASISQSIVHLIQCSVALVKMQGNTLWGFCLFVCFVFF